MPFRFDESVTALDEFSASMFREAALPDRHVDNLPRMNAWMRANPTHAMIDALRRARVAIQNGRPVALVGPCGVGKTQMATALVKRWCAATRRGGRYRRFADMMGEFKAQCFSGHTSEGNWIRNWSGVGLLVLDDIQCCYNTDTERVTLTRLMDHRYGKGLPTVLASNLEPKAFTEFVGPQVASRLREDGELVLCDWPSFRGAKT